MSEAGAVDTFLGRPEYRAFAPALCEDLKEEAKQKCLLISGINGMKINHNMENPEKRNHSPERTVITQNGLNIKHWSSPKRYFGVIFVIIFSIVLIQIFLILKQRFTHDRFFTEIKKCNSEEKNLRFACYRNNIEKFYSQNVDKFINRLID